MQYIDAYKLFTNGGGQYSQYLPDADGEMQQVREQDGEHLTYAGGLRVAQAVLDAIKKEWFPKKGEARRRRRPSRQVGDAGALTGCVRRGGLARPDRGTGFAARSRWCTIRAVRRGRRARSRASG